MLYCSAGVLSSAVLRGVSGRSGGVYGMAAAVMFPDVVTLPAGSAQPVRRIVCRCGVVHGWRVCMSSGGRVSRSLLSWLHCGPVSWAGLSSRDLAGVAVAVDIGRLAGVYGSFDK